MQMPRLDYYIGRPVSKVVKTKNGGWIIHLEGGARITNHDPAREKPEDLAGLQLINVVQGPTTTLRFAKMEEGRMERLVAVDFTPMEYSISDKNYNESEEVYPQRSEAQDEIAAATPEEPAERLPQEPESPQDASDSHV